MHKIEDIINKIHCADCLKFMKEMPDECVDMCMTSPPYWGLRDYGVEQIFGGDGDCEHGWVTQIKKAPHGEDFGETKKITSLNKDTESNYCSKCHAWKGQLGLEPQPEQYIEHLTKIFHEVKRVLKKEGTLWLNIGDTYCGNTHTFNFEDSIPDKEPPPFGRYNIRAKCMMMIPERLAWSLIQDGWILRNKIAWYKPNGMPSSVKDRFSNKWEYLFLFSKSQKYYFDLDVVREPHKECTIERYKRGWDGNGERGYPGGPQNHMKNFFDSEEAKQRAIKLGKNPGDVFTINTHPFPEAHFAVFPEKLVEKPIKAGCPEGGVVLDPFCGSGAALFMAKEMKRRFIGIDIKKEYCKMAEKRIAQDIL